MDWLLLAGADSVENASHVGPSFAYTSTMIVLAIGLVILNGFFVAAEFALVKVRSSQIDKMVADGKPFAKLARWLQDRLDRSLSACQLGVTMASLALGYVGEPAFAQLIRPLLNHIGVASEHWVHAVSFVVAFTFITSVHLVIGEQAPKIYAIREPEKMIRWCALPMVFFYFLLFPFLIILNWVTDRILSWLGLKAGSKHGAPHNEEEIRALLRESHIHGHLTRLEHALLNAVFEFDDMICRLAMVPRGEVDFIDIHQPRSELLGFLKATKHTRYPVCDASLDQLLGVIHIKDLLGIDLSQDDFDLESVMRKPVKVPENMPISKVLRNIQSTHQLLHFVIDEYGTIIGIITLENVLEKIIGPVDDEFDVTEEPLIKILPNGQFLVSGQAPIADVERALKINLDDDDVDTVAGVLMSVSGKLPEEGDCVSFVGATAEILEVKNDHAEKIRFTLESPPEDAPATS